MPLVGVARFERAASWTRTMHSTKLSHTPVHSTGTRSCSRTLIIISQYLGFVNRFSKKNFKSPASSTLLISFDVYAEAGLYP